MSRKLFWCLSLAVIFPVVVQASGPATMATPHATSTPHVNPPIVINSVTSVDTPDNKPDSYCAISSVRPRCMSPCIMAAAAPPQGGLQAAAETRGQKAERCRNQCNAEYDGLFEGDERDACSNQCAYFNCNNDSCEDSPVRDLQGNPINNCKNNCNSLYSPSSDERGGCLYACDRVC